MNDDAIPDAWLSDLDLIEALGGTVATARLLRLAPSVVSGWRVAGRISDRHHARLLALVVQRGLRWRPEGWPADVQLRVRPASRAA